MGIDIVDVDGSLKELSTDIANQLACELGDCAELPRTNDYVLVFESRRVKLLPHDKRHGPIEVDFCGGANAHRRHYGGGHAQLLAKAVGITAKYKPNVIDMTAGLGGDAFVLASLGCKVVMIEQNTVVHCLLYNGLERAREFAMLNDPLLLKVIQNLSLIHQKAQDWFEQTRPIDCDVIYLDPMFPKRQKSAAVKKEMAAFHAILPACDDELSLLDIAQAHAKKRTVVKRSKLAGALSGKGPSMVYKGKSSRFDVYVSAAKK